MNNFGVKRSEAFKDLVVKSYEKLRSGHAVAKSLGVSPGAVYSMLKERGVPLPQWSDPKPTKRTLPLARIPEVLVDYVAGLSFAKMKVKYSCGDWALRDAVKRAGIKRRDHGGQVRRFSKKEQDDICKSYVIDGMPQAAIASMYGSTQIRISRVLRAHGVECGRASGERHGSWKGGRIKTSEGYVSVACSPLDVITGPMRGANGYVLEHRLVVARSLGRPLTAHETVHHINGDKADNRIENLQLRQGKHGNGVRHACADCGSHNVVTVELGHN